MQKESMSFPRAGFFRRLAAMVYDCLVAVAVGMVAAMIISVVLMLLFQNNLIGSHQFEHFSDFIQQSRGYTLLIQIWVFVWVGAFFTWFWKNGGQTIGMRAWRIRLFTTDNTVLSYPRVLLRMLCSLFGLGTLLVLIDVKNKQSLQDRLTKTQVLVLTKEANHHKAWKNL